jgi:serine/threonine protein kinase
MNDSPRQPFGPWVPGEVLGHGGNATVWRATRAGAAAAVALKVLNVTKIGHESYKRFVREIGFLQDHQAMPGLLPLLDAHLPEEPTRANRAWLAMPIATPIAESLATKPLPTVVEAVAAIAATLTRLQDDHNIAHRDIKPGNLYELDGEWLIGDFGLIALPDAESLTTDGRQVGPAHYTAYEMILNPATAQPHPADVYSLGKTLWVLATGQAWPPEGHQPAGTRGFEIGDYRPHLRSTVLDQEVDLMTRLHPEDRPSKGQVARDLAAWQELAAEPAVFDVSEARARLREKLQAQIAGQDTEDQQKDLAHAAVRRLQELTAPLNAGMKDLHPRTRVDLMTDELTQNIVRSLRHDRAGPILFRWQRCTLVAPSDRPMSTALRMSRSLELRDDGIILLHLLILVAPQKVMGSYFEWKPPERSAPVGSAEAEKMLEDAIREMAGVLREAVDVFVERVPAAGNGG